MLIEDEGFEAVFIGSGAGLPKFMGIPGEMPNGVFSANEYLTRSNLMKAFNDDYDTPIARFNKVAIVGGGNVAMGCCKNSVKTWCRSTYRIQKESEAELPAKSRRKYITQKEERYHL